MLSKDRKKLVGTALALGTVFGVNSLLNTKDHRAHAGEAVSTFEKDELPPFQGLQGQSLIYLSDKEDRRELLSDSPTAFAELTLQQLLDELHAVETSGLKLVARFEKRQDIINKSQDKITSILTDPDFDILRIDALKKETIPDLVGWLAHPKLVHPYDVTPDSLDKELAKGVPVTIIADYLIRTGSGMINDEGEFLGKIQVKASGLEVINPLIIALANSSPTGMPERQIVDLHKLLIVNPQMGGTYDRESLLGVVTGIRAPLNTLSDPDLAQWNIINTLSEVKNP